jgi:hypothetical protein
MNRQGEASRGPEGGRHTTGMDAMIAGRATT